MSALGEFAPSSTSSRASRPGFRRRRDQQRLVRDLRRIADGDLTSPAGPRDEVAASVEEIRELIRRILTQADHGARLLSQGWQTMNDVAWAMADTSEATVADAALAARAADEVSANMHIIAAASEQTSATLRGVAAHAGEASDIGQAGVAQVRSAATDVAALKQASQEAEQVLTIITSVARQTHLLALNASIEAARAGDHGKGFAVVAGEVKQLADQTSRASGNVTSTVQSMASGSERAADSMGGVTGTIAEMSARQHSIAAAVEQQTATSRQVAQTTALAAEQSAALARSVQSLTHAVRLTAYSGARARTVAADVAAIEASLRAVVDGFEFEPVAMAEQQIWVLPPGTTAQGSTTTVQNYVEGSGLAEFAYTGTWGQATGNLEAAGTNAHSCMPGDVCAMRFVGTRLRFYGVTAPNHGRARIQIDGGEATVIDQYAPEREHGGLHWESPLLPRGEHTFTLTILAERDLRSRYVWVNVDRVEIDD